MTKSYFWIIITICAFLFSCKEESDYRDEVTGSYEFVTVYTLVNLVDSVGWMEKSDTIHYLGEVRTYGSNQLEVRYRNDSMHTLYDDKPDQVIYPVYEDGKLNFDNYEQGGFTYYTGEMNRNSINIFIQYGWALGGYEKYDIKGTKIN